MQLEKMQLQIFRCDLPWQLLKRRVGVDECWWSGETTLARPENDDNARV
jgi:hypothetical protein